MKNKAQVFVVGIIMISYVAICLEFVRQATSKEFHKGLGEVAKMMVR